MNIQMNMVWPGCHSQQSADSTTKGFLWPTHWSKTSNFVEHTSVCLITAQHTYLSYEWISVQLQASNSIKKHQTGFVEQICHSSVQVSPASFKYPIWNVFWYCCWFYRQMHLSVNAFGICNQCITDAVIVIVWLLTHCRWWCSSAFCQSQL